MLTRSAKWIGGTLLVLIVLFLVLLNLTNWNWLRGPISRTVANKTGRELVIGGDLIVHLGWPQTRIQTANLSFSNPSWAKAKQMVAVKNVELDVSMAPLLTRNIVLNDVRLDSADVSLEKSIDGRKNWLLDRNQKDEKSSIQINALAVNDGRLSYLDPAQKTNIQAKLTTSIKPLNPASTLVFTAEGQFRGQALSAKGSGGGVLALRDKDTPYPLKIAATLGPNSVTADGHITNLLQFSAIDLLIKLHGRSLAELYPLFGIVLPETPPYTTKGRLIREAKIWEYKDFSGQIGKSDIAGTIKVDTGGKRTSLVGTLNMKKLNFADLGPLVGAKKNTTTVKTTAPENRSKSGKVMPNIPFRTERWDRMDADVTLKADSIVRNEALPINNLSTHLRLQNGVLTLDPLKFGVAGGTLAGLVKLDGRSQPIQASTDLKARKIHLGQLFPTLDRTKTSIGLVNGDIDLKGRGNTVADMLGSADGRFAMVINGGEISKLMMEAVGLHLLEMLQLKISGDKNIQINCGVADFNVKHGIMDPKILMLDTDITHITMTGDINLEQEQLDLTLVQKSKKLSLIALRPPIHIRGNFAKPNISLDKSKLATRGLGAIALAIVNPILGLVPLIETGQGKDSDCGRLLKETKVPAMKTNPSKSKSK